MNEWKCTVKTPSNFLQDVYVNAYTHSDAVQFAEHTTGGRCINAVPQYTLSNSSDDDNDSNNLSQTSQDFGFIFFLLIAAFVVYSWKWILLTGIISLVIWGIIHYMKE